MHIHDSVGVVTGSNGGIGQQFVAALLERGATTGLAAAPRPATLGPTVALDPPVLWPYRGRESVLGHGPNKNF
jgi:NAD(P)-dependent dehydrogenase (short-subunit alcohol dehydrogenase family)